MAYEGALHKISSIEAIKSIHDKNDLLFKNKLNKEFDASKEGKNKKFQEELDKKKKEVNDSISLNSGKEYDRIDSDSIDIEFLNAIRNNQESMEEQYIACKIACGEYVSVDEIRSLKRQNYNLLKRAIIVGRQRKNLELKLKMVKNNKEAQVLIFRAKELINKTCISYDNTALDGGTIKVIMRCAIDKAEKKFLNKNLYDDDLQLEINLLEAEVE